MFELNKSKYLAAGALLLVITFCFFLLGNIINIQLGGDKLYPIVSSYIFIMLITILTILLFGIFLKTRAEFNARQAELERLIDTKNTEIESYLRLNKKSQDKKDPQTKRTIDIDNLVHKIVPEEKPENYGLQAYTEHILIHISRQQEIVVGLFYCLDKQNNQFITQSTYAYIAQEKPRPFSLGEGLAGQVAKNQKSIIINEIPSDYIAVYSGLGKSQPRHILITPITYKGSTIGIIELGAFKPFENQDIQLYEHLAEKIKEPLYHLIKEKNPQQ